MGGRERGRRGDEGFGGRFGSLSSAEKGVSEGVKRSKKKGSEGLTSIEHPGR